MAAWEYKVITSGKGGFATPVLLEKFLNDLGREEWEIIEFRSQPDNALAFTGLARRSTQRDWTLENAAAAAARAEAEKLRAEFAAKFQGLGGGAVSSEEAPAGAAEEKAPAGEFRKPVDTSRDFEPEAEDDEKDEWDRLEEEDELPTFFDALKPHMRRNQRGPGMAVGVDYLARKWDLSEDDIKGALVECGFVLPEHDDDKPVYLEYDGDLYWVNANRRGELWINTKEKPRPVFRTVQATKVQLEEEPKREAPAGREAQSEDGGTDGPAAGAEETVQPTGGNRERRSREGREPRAAREAKEPRERENREPRANEAKPAEPVTLPPGLALLEKIRPQMRRNRRGPGGSGSTSFLSRALRCSEPDLLGAFAALGLVVPETSADKPVYVELGDEVWWLNRDQRGGIWINGREKRAGETTASRDAEAAAEAAVETPAPGGTETAPRVESDTTAKTGALKRAEAAGTAEERSAAASPGAQSETAGVLPAVRLLLKETRTGSFAGKLERVATELDKSADELTAALVGAGLKVPEKTREKPVFVEHAGEIFWLNRNAKGELWVNAKASKFAGENAADAGGEEKKPRRSRRRKQEPAAGETTEGTGAGPATADERGDATENESGEIARGEENRGEEDAPEPDAGGGTQE